MLTSMFWIIFFGEKDVFHGSQCFVSYFYNYNNNLYNKI